MFTCTREQVACRLAHYLNPIDLLLDSSYCREARSARLLLIPLTMVSAFLLVIYGIQVIMMHRNTSVEDMAVDRRVDATQLDSLIQPVMVQTTMTQETLT